MGQRDRSVDRFRREGEPCVVDELQSRSSPDRPDPDRALTERVEKWASRGRASSGPDAKIVSSPCSAGPLLPDTGASMRITSGRSAPPSRRRAQIPATPIVLICAQIAPGASAASMPWSRAMDMNGIGIGHHRDDDRRLVVPRRPASRLPPRQGRRGLGSRRVRFQTIVGIPARKAHAAIPWPIVPMPRKATGSFRAPSSSPLVVGENEAMQPLPHEKEIGDEALAVPRSEAVLVLHAVSFSPEQKRVPCTCSFFPGRSERPAVGLSVGS